MLLSKRGRARKKGWGGRGRNGERVIEKKKKRGGGSVDLLKTQTWPVSPPTHPLTSSLSSYRSLSLSALCLCLSPTPSWRDGTAPETGRSRSSINREELLGQEQHTHTHTVSPLLYPHFLSLCLSALSVCPLSYLHFSQNVNTRTHTEVYTQHTHAQTCMHAVLNSDYNTCALIHTAP